MEAAVKLDDLPLQDGEGHKPSAAPVHRERAAHAGRPSLLYRLAALFRSKGTFAHGIHPVYHKETARLPIKRLPFASHLIVPLAQHIGKPALCCVNVGQEVMRGQVIATADGRISLPLHAPATGVVEAIGLMPSAAGRMEECITIRVYQADGQEVRVRKPCDVDAMNRQELLAAIQDSGLCGLGGATFPAHVKLD
ncbi:MAG: hypothetical protein Q8L69_15355, partial [Gallionellaceae bacterium]|nr:hypothetical protein [Gallionellaceae bacterium]